MIIQHVQTVRQVTLSTNRFLCNFSSSKGGKQQGFHERMIGPQSGRGGLDYNASQRKGLNKRVQLNIAQLLNIPADRSRGSLMIACARSSASFVSLSTFISRGESQWSATEHCLPACLPWTSLSPQSTRVRTDAPGPIITVLARTAVIIIHSQVGTHKASWEFQEENEEQERKVEEEKEKKEEKNK